MPLFYREIGEGNPIIILHGLFGASDNWLTIAKELSKDYKIILPDLRNHGKSFHSDEFSYDVMLEDIATLINENNWLESIVIGHSMGGKTAMFLAAKYPDLIKKLVVVDIGPKSYPIHHQTILEGLGQIDLNQLSSRGEADKILSKYVDEIGVRQFLLKNLSRNDQQKFEWKINLKAITDHIANVGQALSLQAIFDKTTLFIRGENSNYIVEEDYPLINQMFPKSEIKIIQRAGHWIHAEQPKEFLKVVRDFI